MKNLFNVKTFYCLIVVFAASLGANATVLLQFPASNGSGTMSGGTPYHCRSFPQNDFPVNISVKTPTTGSGSTELSYQVWWDSYLVETIYYGYVNNDGAYHDITANIAANTMRSGGMYKIVAVWNPYGMPVNEASQEYYILTEHVALSIAGSSADGTVVLAPCDGNINIKGAGFTCPGNTFDLTLNVSEVDLTTYAPVGNNVSRVLTSLDISQLQGGTFGLKPFCNVGANGVTLSFVNKRRYRVQLIMSGPSVWRERTQYFMFKTSSWDLVIKDHFAYKPLDYNFWGTDDEGAEENRIGYNMYQSPDLWNELVSTGMNGTAAMSDIPGETRHQSPEFSVSQNMNYMYAKINNIGCATSQPVNLRMFWTRARLGETWSDHWLYNLTNNFTVDGSGVRRPLGSEITITGATQSSPYNTSIAPVAIPPISSSAGANAYIIQPQSWYVPDPSWYNINNGVMNGRNRPVICLLGRIQEKSGVSDPIVWEPAGTSTNIDPYVSQNNNVATRNTTLLQSAADLSRNGQVVAGLAQTPYHTVIANNPSSSPTRICLRDISPVSDFTLSEYGEMHVAFTSDIWSNWMAGGMLGSGFQVVGPGEVAITNDQEACFENITIGNNMNAQLGVSMIWDINASYPMTTSTFRYAMQQENMPGFSAYHGSDVVFLLPVAAPTISGGAASFSLLSSGTTSSSKIVKKKSDRSAHGVSSSETNFGVLLFPNPASNLAVLTLTGIDQNASLAISVKDVTGKTVIADVQADVMHDNAVAKISLDELANGVYYVTILHNGNQAVEKLIIQK